MDNRVDPLTPHEDRVPGYPQPDVTTCAPCEPRKGSKGAHFLRPPKVSLAVRDY